MPLYEYKCDSCGATFEVIQRFSDPPVKACRVCGKPVQKVLSAPAIQFKGSGWYVTDYAKKGTSEPVKSESAKKTAEATPPISSESSKDAAPKAATESAAPAAKTDKS